jgi:hypothetical protein
MATLDVVVIPPSPSTSPTVPRDRGQEPVVMTETPIPSSPVFYACTAVTPDGPPIEVAWVTRAFEAYGLS